MIVAVDFDNTLALGNFQYISMLQPNTALIDRLVKLRAEINPEIVIVTARGAKDGLSEKQKVDKYRAVIKDWLNRYGVPFDQISFNKEYANLYIDDQVIGPDDSFSGLKSSFTGNKVILTPKTAVKFSDTAPLEHEWYKVAKFVNCPAPDVLFCNNECIITSRIIPDGYVDAKLFIFLLSRFKKLPAISDHDFSTYLNNIKPVPDMSENTIRCLDMLQRLGHFGTFFHGDLSTTNVLVKDGTPYLIDPNCKHIFGSYKTDAGKAVFSLIAYESSFGEAEKIVKEFGSEIWYFAVAEGLRVCKYRPEYISIVNNIADVATG